MYWKAVGPQRFKFNSLVNFGGRHIYIDDTKSTEYNKICENNVKKLVQSVAIIVPLVVFGHFLVVLGSLHAYIYEDTRVTPMATHLPYFEKNSDLEFILNLLQQSIIAVYALMGNISIEILTCLLNNAITSIPEFIHLNLNDLNKEISIDNSNLKTMVRLRNVLIQVQDFDRYANQFSISQLNIFYIVFGL